MSIWVGEKSYYRVLPGYLISNLTQKFYQFTPDKLQAQILT
jgi:hypothetical protein